jgi:hypothetical protein
MDDALAVTGWMAATEGMALASAWDRTDDHIGAPARHLSAVVCAISRRTR